MAETKNIEPNPQKIREMVRSDLNLEKWNLFATQRTRGFRVLKRERTVVAGKKLTQQVYIGLKGSEETLTTEEGKLFYLFLDMWEKNGRKPDGVIFTSLNKIFNELVSRKDGGEPKNVRRGNWSKTWFIKKIKKMISIPIVYESAYEEKDGTLKSLESFTLLDKADVFDRKINTKQSYFEFSRFVIHPTIVKSILEKNVKPIRLDVIVGLKKEISVILYRYLDLIMADKVQYERDLAELMENLDMGPTRSDNILREMRETCLELEGKDMSTGKITYCRIEKRVNGKGWKLVVKKGKFDAIPERRAPNPNLAEAFQKLALNNSLKVEEIAQEDALLNLYDKMNVEQKMKVNMAADKIFKDKYKSFGGDFTKRMAFLDALKSTTDPRFNQEPETPAILPAEIINKEDEHPKPVD